MLRRCVSNHGNAGFGAYLPGDFALQAFALLLLVAAGLKGELLVEQYGRFPAWGRSEVAKASLIIFECVVAAWLLSGVATIAARKTALILLTVFMCVAGWRLFTKAEGCGCFGRVNVRPSWTFSLDALLAFFIWIYAKRQKASSKTSASTVSTRATGLRLCLAILLTAAVPPAVAKVVAGTGLPTTQRGEAFVLDPKTWPNESLPLLNELDPPMPEIAHGRWVVALVDHDCSLCQDFISRTPIFHTSDAFWRKGKDYRPIVIDLSKSLPPSGHALNVSVPTARIKNDLLYVVAGPWLVYVDGGSVVATDLIARQY